MVPILEKRMQAHYVLKTSEDLVTCQLFQSCVPPIASCPLCACTPDDKIATLIATSEQWRREKHNTVH